MLFTRLALTLYGVWLVSAQSTTKVSPPLNRGVGSYPAFFIYKDVDEIARPGGKLDVCGNVKTIRNACYNLGVKQKSYAAEQECLCAQQAALGITQCFAQQYTALKNETLKSQLRQSFLYYTYDCYCGVKEVDPTYNTTATPVEPFVKGFTGDPILPPVDGCPAKGAPPNVCPVKPPCSSCSVPQPPLEPPCPSGNNRCSGTCIPECPPPDCNFPKFAYNGQCVCPCGWEEEGSDSCVAPTCGANQEYIVGPGCRGQCVCVDGYEWSEKLGECQETCPDGQERPAPGAPCETTCTAPEIKDWSGECVCPYSLGYSVNDAGECVVFSCESPLVPAPYYQSCFCPQPYYVSQTDGSCIEPLCYDTWNPECYPDLVYANDTIAIESTTPDVMSYSDVFSGFGPSSTDTISQEPSVTPAPESESPTTSIEEAVEPSTPVEEESVANPSPEPTPSDVEPTPQEPSDTPVDSPVAETPVQETPRPTANEPSPAEATPEEPAPEEATPSAMRRLRWARNV